MKTIYVASKNMDSTEGRGPMVPVGYFTKLHDARLAVRGLGVMGVGDGDVDEVILHETFGEYQMDINEKLRRTALSKLSEAERKALGF